jgi:hypothetical protein
MGKASKKTATSANKAGGKGVNSLFTRTAFTETVPLDSLTFDRRLQHRAQLFDNSEGGAVDQYAEADKEDAKADKPTRFPALRVVREKAEDGTVTNWVYDGFQRGEAFRYNKRKTVPIEFVEGTFDDAFILSLSSNSENSVLPRNKDDKRRSVYALLDNENATALAFKVGPKFGGVMKAIAAICGVSVGTVDNAMIDRGVKVKGDKIVSRGKSDRATPSGGGKGGKGGAGAPTEPPKELTEAEKKKLSDANFAAMRQAAYADRVNEGEKLIRRLGAIMASLVTDSVHAAEVKKIMRAQKLALDSEFDVRAEKQGADFTPYYEILELWPVTSKVGTLFAELKKIKEVPPKEDEKEPATEKDAGEGKESGK